MEKAKIKNLIILILALMNIFLLLIVISDALESARSRAVRNESIYELLAARSITLSDDVKIIDVVPTEITLKRNLGSEERMLTSLIGRTSVTDKGGDIFIYNGAGGSASFRGTGDFSLALDSGSILMGSDPVKSSLSVLGKMGISSNADSAQVKEEEKNSAEVTLNCTYKGAVVFNAEVTCSFTNGRLSTITGRRLLDDVESKTTPDKYADIATIIMNFLQNLEDSGNVCTRIAALDSGYFAESKTVGSYTLLPTWRITTDFGIYYFDALTGHPVYSES